MKRILPFFLAILCTLLVGCEPMGYKGDDLAAYTLVQYQCPTQSSGFSYSEIVEQDEYGRTLFKFWGGSDLAYESDKGTLYIYAILQKDTDDFVWFYDLVCYMMNPSWEAFTEERLNELKDRNDWNRELDLSQAIQVKRVPENDRHIGVSHSISAITDIASNICESDEFYNYLPICNDQNGKTLYFIRTYKRDQNGYAADFSSYAVILNADSTYSDSSIVKLDDFYDHAEELMALRAATGWESIREDD